MKAVLFGAGGQLGIDLARECRQRGHSVLALSREECDVSRAVAVRLLIERERPDCVINAAAYNDVDGAERNPQAARSVNADAAARMADACRACGATLLHFSSDFVFPGDRVAAYTEADVPRPLSEYGSSKLAGETEARSRSPAHYVLRTAGVYGTPGRFTRRRNFVEFIMSARVDDGPQRIVCDRFATPTFGAALAARSIDVLERRIPYGLYHLAGGETISWYEFARKIASASHSGVEIVPVAADDREARQGQHAPRPQFSALSNAAIEAEGVEPMPSIDECLAEYMRLRLGEMPTS